MIESLSVQTFELIDLHQNDLKLDLLLAMKLGNVSKVVFQPTVGLLNQSVEWLLPCTTPQLNEYYSPLSCLALHRLDADRT